MGFQIIVVYKRNDRKTPYLPQQIENVKFVNEAEFNDQKLKNLAKEFDPDLTFICDWSMPKYNSVGLFLRRKKKIPVIVACDTPWRGGRQWLNVIASSFRHKRYFSHVLVAGVRQFEYAKKLGFKNDDILLHSLSANVDLFHNTEVALKKFKEKKNFLYVGRFVPVKGLEYLVQAWNLVNNKDGHTLTLVGNGPILDNIDLPEDVIVRDFTDQRELTQLAEESICFIISSVHENWSLVIHEFAAAGLPMIVTSECGASPHFVVNNYNGYKVKSRSVTELKEAVEKIISADPKQLYKFGIRSRELSKSITPEIIAGNIASVL